MRVNNEQQNLSASNDAWEAPAPADEANAAQLADLRLTAEELDGIKGGCGPFHEAPSRPPIGGYINNHNETTVSDGEDEQGFFEFADLSLTDEQLAEIKGGGGGGWGCHDCGFSNHNETMAEDEADLLDDLTLDTAQADDIKAGCFNCWGPPLANHNETVAEDGVAEGAELADLSVAVAQAEEIKGGPEHQQQLREVILMGITR